MLKEIWKKSKMINEIFDVANLLTYIGLISAVIGICLCSLQQTNIAILCLIVSGICDGFDGMVARKLRKNGNEGFGVQLDSLVDIISSGIFPVILCLSMKYNSILDIIVYTFFIIAGVTRLAYYNIVNEENKGHFIGVPITSSTIIIPIIYFVFNKEIAFIASLLTLAILYISQIKIKKLNTCGKVILALAGIFGIIYMILRGGMNA